MTILQEFQKDKDFFTVGCLWLFIFGILTLILVKSDTSLWPLLLVFVFGFILIIIRILICIIRGITKG
jgi:hypothetical protein